MQNSKCVYERFASCVSVFSRSAMVCIVRKYPFPSNSMVLISCSLFNHSFGFALCVNKLSL